MPSVIVSYCSNEKAFIDSLLQQCREFSDDIVVSYGSHLYDGRPEDLNHIQALIERYPGVRFVKYNVDVAINLKVQKGVQQRPKAYWHNLARYTAMSVLRRDDWVFVLDSDEIPEGKKVNEWLENTRLNEDICYKLANYWYFKDVCNQATTWEDSVLLIHSKHLTADNIFGDNERDYTIKTSGCVLQRQIVGLDGKPMWHHFSFVRTKNGLMHKIKNWGHASEGDSFGSVDAVGFLNYVFKDEKVNDIVHGYDYKKAENIFQIEI